MSGNGIRRAKIVCTIGPATSSPEMFSALVDAGMDAVRINFSHAGHEEAARIQDLARNASRERERPLAVIADLQGPKIRVGDLGAPLPIEKGADYTLVPEGDRVGDGGARLAAEGARARADGPGSDGPAPGPAYPADRVIPTTYAGLGDDIAAGDRILLDDGRLELRAIAVEGPRVVARAERGGMLASQKGINLPGVDVRAPGLTDKDRADAKFACAQGVDYLAQSFVRRPRDIEDLREVAGESGPLIIAKIEKAQAVRNLADILRQSDGVMVARGDLGVELPYEDVPMVQKRILRLSRELARFSITATQMLESMTRAPRPTRAEVSDVANALLDGTDAVMLAAETATGAYPLEAVGAMDRIIRRLEVSGANGGLGAGGPGLLAQRPEVQETTSAAIAAAALGAVDRLDAPFIVTFTRRGYTARIVAAQRPAVPILAITDEWRTYNQLALVWGVQPVLFRGEVSYREMLERAREKAAQLGLGESGQSFVVTAGVPFHEPGTTNMMRVERL